MAKYRKRPVVIDAFQWHGESVEGIDRIPVGCDELGEVTFNLIIPTLEGDMYASEGDWIIKGVLGELYPCKPAAFEQTYQWESD